METLQFHPASELFPLMQEEELEEFVADIQKNGLEEEIELYEGMILDGRNRYLACRRLGIDPRFKDWEGDSPTTHVISMNLRRRHLSIDERARIAVDSLPMFEEEVRKRKAEAATEAAAEKDRDEAGQFQSRSGSNRPTSGQNRKSERAVSRAAAAAGVGRGSVKRLRWLEKTHPELAAQVGKYYEPLGRKLSITAAYMIAKGKTVAKSVAADDNHRDRMDDARASLRTWVKRYENRLSDKDLYGLLAEIMHELEDRRPSTQRSSAYGPGRNYRPIPEEAFG